MNTDRPIYIVHLQPEQGDPVHTLRAALKVLLRRFRLRCISVEERQPADKESDHGRN